MKGYFKALIYNATKKYFKDKYCSVFVIVPHSEQGSNDPTMDPARFNRIECLHCLGKLGFTCYCENTNLDDSFPDTFFSTKKNRYIYYTQAKKVARWDVADDEKYQVVHYDPHVIHKITYHRDDVFFNKGHIQEENPPSGTDMTEFDEGYDYKDEKFTSLIVPDYHVYTFNKIWGWKKWGCNHWKRLPQKALTTAMKNRECIMQIPAGRRMKEKEDILPLGGLPPIHEDFQAKSSDDMRCVWLSACIMVSMMDFEKALDLARLSDSSFGNPTGEFNNLLLLKEQTTIDGNKIKSMARLLTSNSSFEVRKYKMSNSKLMNLFNENCLSGCIVAVLLDSNRSAHHCIGIDARTNNVMIYDPCEEHALPFSQSNLDRCCGSQCSFRGFSAMVGIVEKPHKKMCANFGRIIKKSRN